MITVTGATGHFGRLAIDELLIRGVPADQIVAAVRTPEKATDLALRGIQIRQADYDHPATLATAFTGMERLLFISSSEFGRQAEQHANVVRAAKDAGATELIYTSYLNADSSGIAMAEPHTRTEELIRASGIPYSILRNGSYIENYTANIGMWLQYGTIIGSAGDGKISGATRADLATAAAVVAVGAPVANRVYELGGTPFTMSDLAAETTAQTGTTVTYTDMPPDEYSKTLSSAGLPQFLTDAIADNSAGAARGGWYTDSKELQKLLGRPATSAREALAQALAQQQG
ncbi:NAD(P)H-binding protein [Streptomyces sp. NPDC050509]|uniref:NAD(P)H-binding protein n=1 Tax=Streptomyces sp. NPDC050509 TaxID=3365620 RepID=UPI0037A0F059